MTFTMDGMNMGRTHVIPALRGAGVWEAEGFYLGMPGIAQIGIGISRQSLGDAGAVFRIEVPDVSAEQFGGLRASLAGVVRPALDASSLERGRSAYARQCSVCHGAGGTGNGPAVADGEFASPSPDGRRLAYVRSAPPPARGQALWWSALDGGGGREIVSANVFDKLFAVRFAPDGKRLVFAAVGQPPDAAPRSLGSRRPLGLFIS